MKAIDLIKLAIPQLPIEELVELHDFINGLVVDKNNLYQEIQRLWKEEGRLQAIKYFYYNQIIISGKSKLGLEESKNFVGSLCIEIEKF